MERLLAVVKVTGLIGYTAVSLCMTRRRCVGRSAKMNYQDDYDIDCNGNDGDDGVQNYNNE